MQILREIYYNYFSTLWLIFYLIPPNIYFVYYKIITIYNPRI